MRLLLASLLLLPGQAVVPEEVVKLFNGKDFTGLTTWLKESRTEDPKKVFQVTDGMLHFSGDGNGYVATDKEYRDYRLVVEFKWGEKTYGAKYVRNSGILLHATGPDGAAGAWPSSIECQLAQGCVGDFIVIKGKDAQLSITSEIELGTDKRPRWKKGGTPTVYSGRQFWWSKHEAGFKELIDTRGKDDVESPLGEWTKVEIECRGDRISVFVNGTQVNECYDVKPAAGRICLQTEGFEVWFRSFELHPLVKK
jgi:hypothetical protein